MAIVSPAQILPMNRIDERAREVALDLIYDRRTDAYDPLQEFIELFEGVEGGGAAKREDELKALPLEERLKRRIIDGARDGLQADLDDALQSHSALDIINDYLLEGMKVVGQLFASGEMQLPFVLQSAETMKAAVAHLEPHMEKVEGGGKGKVFYGRDAFEGLHTMDALMTEKRGGVAVEAKPKEKKVRKATPKVDVGVLPARSDVATDVSIPTPPFFGSRVVKAIEVPKVAEYLNKVALYRGQ